MNRIRKGMTSDREEIAKLPGLEIKRGNGLLNKPSKKKEKTQPM